MRNWLSEFSRNSKTPPGKIDPHTLRNALIEFKAFIRLNDSCTAVLYACCMHRGKKEHVSIGELSAFLEPLLHHRDVVLAVESLVIHGFLLYGSEGPFTNYYNHVYLSPAAETALRTSDKKALPTEPNNDADHMLMIIYARAVSFRNRSIGLKDWIHFTEEIIQLRELPFIQHLYRAKLSKKHRAIALFTGVLHQIDQHRLEQSTLLQLFCNSALELARLNIELQNTFHPLFAKELLERFTNEHGLVRIGAHSSWSAIIHHVDNHVQQVRPESPALQLFDHQTIHPKTLFYNPDTKTKVLQLQKILMPSNLRKFEKLMVKNGEPTGIISLLSGGPGTGKTELAKQLALETGRDLLVFDVTQQRNMYFGETEKAIKHVFDDYRRICKHSKHAPILFFNEGDAVFNNRSDLKSNTSQTENSVQTILLQEMEIFQGIMIITTNRPASFDPAFERRILLHIPILDPVAEVRLALVRHLFPSIADVDAKRIAENYAFTAAQLGVFRKQWELETIIRLRREKLEVALENFLKGINQKPRHAIGFVAA